MDIEALRKGISELMDGCYNGTNHQYPELRAFQGLKFLDKLMPYLESYRDKECQAEVKRILETQI